MICRELNRRTVIPNSLLCVACCEERILDAHLGYFLLYFIMMQPLSFFSLFSLYSIDNQFLVCSQ